MLEICLGLMSGKGRRLMDKCRFLRVKDEDMGAIAGFGKLTKGAPGM